MKTLATIGYEQATVPNFLETLRKAKVELLVDVRAVASSRRPGFAKTKLKENLEGAGIGYLHLRGLGTPAEGRKLAHAGKVEEMHRIYREHLRTEDAQDELGQLIELVRTGPRVCLLCLEADPERCHRSIVAAEVAKAIPVRIEHLHP